MASMGSAVGTRGMKVLLKNRDHTERAPLPFHIEVERYSWNMIGGPERAYLHIANADMDVLDLLRLPVEIYGSSGDAVWWGYVNRATKSNGTDQTTGYCLDNMFNSVTARYDGNDTSAATDPASIANYGTKEARITVANATQAQAEQRRDLALADSKNPTFLFEYSGSKQGIFIECLGWYNTLDWKYYSDSDETNTANETQIINTVASAGQFITGTIVHDASGFTSNEYRDGTTTGLDCVGQHLVNGTSNVRPYLCYVDIDRTLHVYERAARPSEPAYILLPNNKLTTLPGDYIADEKCKVGVWAKLKNYPNNQAFFIESAEWNTGKTRYKPAGDYDQQRQAKFVADITDTNTGGGVGTSSRIWWTPEADPLHRDIKTVYGTYTADIAAGSSYYLHPNSSLTSYINIGNTKLVETTVGSGAGRAAWGVDDDSEQGYFMSVHCNIVPGTTAPTTGWCAVATMRARKGAGIYVWTDYESTGHDALSGGWGSGGDDAESVSMFATTELNTNASYNEGFVFKIYNYTDGDIQISLLKVTFERVTY